MLTALNEEGKMISLIAGEREKVLRMRKLQQFFCPICLESVIIKAGEVRIPHFAHKRYSECASIVTEPESPQHLQGKKDLYSLFKANHLETKLEHYIPNIKQRPDLLVTYDKRHYAIEFQCTPISPSLVFQRTNNYLTIGIIPVWIVGGFPFQKKLRNSFFRLTEFLWSMTKRRNESRTLIAYRPENRHLYSLSQITSITPQRVYAHLHTKRLHTMHLPFQLVKQKQATQPDLHLWKAEKQKWLEQKVRFGHLHDPFLKAVYTSRNNPFLLPHHCGLPVPYMEYFQSHTIEWQFYIWNDCFQKIKEGQRISLNYVYYKMKTRMKSGHLIYRSLIDENGSSWKSAVLHYFYLLESLGYFSAVGKGLFKMNKKILAPNHIEEAMSNEKLLYKLLEQKSRELTSSSQRLFLLD